MVLPILQEAYTYIYNVEAIEAIGEDPENLGNLGRV